MLLDRNELLNDATAALATGNLLAALRAYHPVLRRASYLQQVGLFDDLRALVALAPPVAEQERLRAAGILDRLPFGPEFPATEKRELLAALERVPRLSAHHAIGTVNVLVVSLRPVAGIHYGAVQPLSVTVDGWGAGPLFPYTDVDEEFRRSFGLAVRAVTQWLIDTLDAGLVVAGRVRDLTLTASLPRALCPVGGGSAGLGAGLAIVSRLLRLPVPTDVGVTGGLTASGEVEAVGGLAEKLEAAMDRGLRVVFLPNPGPATEKVASGVEVQPVGSLGAAIEIRDVRGSRLMRLQPVGSLGAAIETLYKAEVLSKGLELFRESLREGPTSLRSRTVDAWADHTKLRQRVLVSWLGNRDPFPPRPQQLGSLPGLPEPHEPEPEPGALIELVRVFQPTTVHVLYTDNPTDDPARVQACLRQLEKDAPGIVPVFHQLSEVRDPTDFAQLLTALRSRLSDTLAGAAQDPETMLLVNSSSGTPQMMVAILFLVERRAPNACIMQVRERRHVSPGEHRVRQVSLPLG